MSEPTCRLCGCTWNDACVDDERGACSWAEPDLCSHCKDSAALLTELIDGTGRAEPTPADAEVGEIILPMHHAEQLAKILQHRLGPDIEERG